MKRYIRTKEGKFIDTKNFNHQKRKSFNYKVENNFIEIIAESDNVFDLIQKWDLIGGLWFGLEDDHRCCKDVYRIIPNIISVYTATGESCSFSDIQWIFTKQGDNYILVWDKERGVI